MRRLPRGSQLKCLTRWSRRRRRRSMPGRGQRVVEQPACRSNEWMPFEIFPITGLLADEHQAARAGPSPNTVCVARFQRSQARQSCAAARTTVSVLRKAFERQPRRTILQTPSGVPPGCGLRRGDPRRCAGGPRALARFIALPRETLRAGPSSDIAARSRHCGASQTGRGCHAGSSLIRRGRVPRAHFLADVAAVDVRADRLRRSASGISPRCSMVRYEMQRVGVEHAGRDERLRRARLEAQRAGAALIERRRVGVERQAADDLGEEDPRPELGMDHAACSCRSTRRRHAARRRAPGPGPVSTYGAASNGSGCTSCIQATSASSRRADAPRGSRRPTRSARCGRASDRRTRSNTAGRCCRRVAGDDHRSAPTAARCRTSARRSADRAR